MLCPRCQSDLRETIYEGVIVDTCGKCEGEWLDKAEILLINKAREVVFSEQEQTKVKGAQEVVTTELKQPEKPLICPRCNVPLKVLNYAYSTGIIVDRCIKCDGLWLDKDELEHIQIVIEEWEKETPELEAKFIPALAQMKEEYDEKRKKHIDEIIAKRKEIKGAIKSPMLDAMAKAILYRFF
jgi:Zn-finger nucleic acid-binding protein